ncbi:MAG: chloramphenicol acetyltransferase [Bacteroidetes bacterium]|nr:chloramphenicol acetyltransferase [Bacteroidota bacterium]
MKSKINIDQWNRKEHFLFFSKFTEPFFGVTVKIDVTNAYYKAKENGISFFLHYLYCALKAANQIENFRYRIIDQQVYNFDKVHASPTINRPNGTFGFAYMNYDEDENVFYKNALAEIEQVQQTNLLLPANSGENVIHFSALPWLDFTSISHARSFDFPDSCPKISFGKMTDNNGVKEMPVSVHVHHALMDGYHVGMFIENFQNLLNL